MTVQGLYLEGAVWDGSHDSLADPKPGVMACPMPPVRFEPVASYDPPEQWYHCPCYKTSDRIGTLSTTGQSTNFILYVDLPSKHHRPDHWTLRGAALITQHD
jgi:dynein heavy chain